MMALSKGVDPVIVMKALLDGVMPDEDVYAGEIDSDVAKTMPRALLLVRGAGGIKPADASPLFNARMDVWSYGKTPFEAGELSTRMHFLVQGTNNVVIDGARVLGITLSSGPLPGREFDTGWAYTLRTYIMLLSEQKE